MSSLRRESDREKEKEKEKEEKAYIRALLAVHLAVVPQAVEAQDTAVVFKELLCGADVLAHLLAQGGLHEVLQGVHQLVVRVDGGGLLQRKGIEGVLLGLGQRAAVLLEEGLHGR